MAINRRRMTIIIIVLAIPLLAIAWWLGSPLFIDQEVNETFPAASAGTVTTAAPGDETPSSSSQAVELAGGLFTGADDFHEGAGRATIYDLGSGDLVLRLEAFSVTNGPDLHVYLVPDPDPIESGDVSGFVDLGALKGNLGDQNYEIPDGVEVDEFSSVVIYCEPFSVVFSAATIS